MGKVNYQYQGDAEEERQRNEKSFYEEGRLAGENILLAVMLEGGKNKMWS